LTVTSDHLSRARCGSIKELMSRMGHASTRAALIYQHASQDRDRVIGEACKGLGPVTRVTRARRNDRARNGHGSRSDHEHKQGPGGETGFLPGPSQWERATGIEPA